MQIEPHSGIPDVPGFAEARGLRSFAAVAAVIAAVALVYWPTSASMVAIWSRSDTFAHGFLVVPAVLWMTWASRWQLAAQQVRPSWFGLVPLSAAGTVWLLGELAGALGPTQWAVVLMVPGAVLTLFGWPWLKVLAFPLAFLVFAVPFGEIFVPTLIDWTADFTVAALQVSGVPVFREGTHFVIPSGRWSVVEACSGIRYLIASVVVGALYAWLMYRSAWKRFSFMAVAVAVPLVANWMRAYLIVMVGHLSDNRIAAGVDHLIYGWFFFGIVIALLFWAGTRWREDRDPGALARASSDRSTVEASVLKESLLPPARVLVSAGLLIGIWPFVLDGLLAAGDKRPIAPVAVKAGAGWVESQLPGVTWEPSLEGPAHKHVQAFERAGVQVTVFVAHYRDQRQGSELVNSMNRLVPETSSTWDQIDRGTTAADFGFGSTRVRTATLRGAGHRLRVWHWYSIDGQIVTGDLQAKLRLGFDRLRMQSDTSAWVAISTSAASDADADSVLRAFAREMGPSLQSALAATAAR